MAPRSPQGPSKGISYWCFPGGVENRADVLGAAGAAAQLGLRSLELGISDTGALKLQTSRSECQALARACAAAGVGISALVTGLYWTSSPASPRPADRARAAEITAAALERAAWLGAGAVVVFPGWVLSPFGPRAETAPYGQALELARETLRGCVRPAEKLRVRLALANAWGGLPLSPREMAALVDSFRSKRVAACLDTGAAELAGGAEHWAAELGRRIALVRVTDARRRFEPDAGRVRAFRDLGAVRGLGFMAAFCEPGRGTVPWPALMAELRRARYRGPLTYASHPSAPGLPERAANFLETLTGSG